MKQKRIKRKYKMAIIFIAFTLVAAIYMLIYFMSRSELEKAIYSCRDSYKRYWSLEKVEENTRRKHIYIEFEEHFAGANERQYSMKKTYDAITLMLFENENSKWKDYMVDINFRVSYLGEYFRIENITSNMQSLEITSQGSGGMAVHLKTISEYFPSTKKLYLRSAFYDSIQEIQGFENLEEVYIPILTEEEINYIHSLYPDCIVRQYSDSLTVTPTSIPSITE